MPKKTKPVQHVINWNPRARTLVRGSREPYIISEIHKPEKVDQGMIDNGYDKFTIPKIHI